MAVEFAGGVKMGELVGSGSGSAVVGSGGGGGAVEDWAVQSGTSGPHEVTVTVLVRVLVLVVVSVGTGAAGAEMDEGASGYVAETAVAAAKRRREARISAYMRWV